MNVPVLFGALFFWAAAWATNEYLVRIQPANRNLARAIDLFVPILFGITLLVLWEGVTRGLNVSPVLLPPPSMIWLRLTASVPLLWADFQQTFIKSVLVGFALGCSLGFVVAVLVDRSPFL
ncbi:MAG TPA: ABC transporter permease, partial [Devosia sp.]|nr:ABC transporter permease [Devosia sp.]